YVKLKASDDIGFYGNHTSEEVLHNEPLFIRNCKCPIEPPRQDDESKKRAILSSQKCDCFIRFFPLTTSKGPSIMIFGLIPQELHEQLLDLKNYQNRTNGVEELKKLLFGLDLKPVPSDSIVEFIYFLHRLLDDTNFKVLYGTLQVINLLIQKLDYNIDKYFKQIVCVALKPLGDNRAVTRNEYMNVFRQLTRIVGPQKVLDLAIGHLRHKNSRVREDVINIITAAMLTHPKKDFNIPSLCFEVAPYLADSKKKVRHAALELFAVFDHCLDTGKKQPLMKAVDRVELNGDVEGLMAAVQARRARHILPRLSSDGMVEYALLIPKSGQRRSPQFGSGADLEWVLNGGRISSAKSIRTEPDSDRLYHGYGSLGSLIDDLPLQRRIVSAGKGKNKLPWERSSLPSTVNIQPCSTSNGKSSDQDLCVAVVHKARLLPGTPGVERTFSLPLAQGTFLLPSYPLATLPGGLPTPTLSRRHAESSLSMSNTWPNKRESSPHRLDPSSWKDISSMGLVSTAYYWVDPGHHVIYICIHSTLSPCSQVTDEQMCCCCYLQMLNSLRSLRCSAAKKKAKVSLSGSDHDPDSPDSAMKLELALDSPSQTSPTVTSPASKSSIIIVLYLIMWLCPPDELSPGTPSQKSDLTEHPELQPFSKPELALTQSFKLLNSDDWEKKIEGLTFLRGLTLYHSDVLRNRLHDVCLALIQEVRNLRSGVSRVAVGAMGELYTALQKGMDQELEATAKALLQKAGESNAFIRQDVDAALDSMVQHCTPTRSLNALLTSGLSHLNSVVRKCAGHHMVNLMENIGAARLLSGGKDLTDRILPAIIKLSQDSSQEARYQGRRMLLFLSLHPDFDKMLEKYIPAKDLAPIRDTVFILKTKGLGEMPQDTPSGRGRRSLPGSGTVRASSLSREPLKVVNRESGQYSGRPQAHSIADKTEYIKQLTALLGSKDFRERIKGIDQLVVDCEHSPNIVIGSIFPVFDAFKARLQESNSKVNLFALESLQKIITVMKDNLAQVVYILVPAIVDNHLNSKNNAIYSAAIGAIHALIQNLDKTLLLQPFCSKAQFLSGKAKVDLIEKVADLVTELYPRKPQVVEQKALPLLWHLLGTSSHSGTVHGRGGSVRGATSNLCQALYTHMGPGLAACAASQDANVHKGLNEFLRTLPSP
uniref:TOG domain-containing protein n=1 Tax=Oncorhynchus kisutch TaxID=8019 RepID=A0A8C7FTW3_ONCKI